MIGDYRNSSVITCVEHRTAVVSERCSSSLIYIPSFLQSPGNGKPHVRIIKRSTNVTLPLDCWFDFFLNHGESVRHWHCTSVVKCTFTLYNVL